MVQKFTKVGLTKKLFTRKCKVFYPMEELRVVNIFRFQSSQEANSDVIRKRDNEIKETISQMEKLAATYNFSDEPVTLHFFGDTKSGVHFRVECDDAETKLRVTNALKMYQKNL